jgi:hypothetical protein
MDVAMYVRQLGLLVCILTVVIVIVRHPHGVLLCCSAGVIDGCSVFDWSTSPLLRVSGIGIARARQQRSAPAALLLARDFV